MLRRRMWLHEYASRALVGARGLFVDPDFTPDRSFEGSSCVMKRSGNSRLLIPQINSRAASAFSKLQNSHASSFGSTR